MTKSSEIKNLGSINMAQDISRALCVISMCRQSAMRMDFGPGNFTEGLWFSRKTAQLDEAYELILRLEDQVVALRRDLRTIMEHGSI